MARHGPPHPRAHPQRGRAHANRALHPRGRGRAGGGQLPGRLPSDAAAGGRAGGVALSRRGGVVDHPPHGRPGARREARLPVRRVWARVRQHQAGQLPVRLRAAASAGKARAADVHRGSRRDSDRHLAQRALGAAPPGGPGVRAALRGRPPACARRHAGLGGPGGAAAGVDPGRPAPPARSAAPAAGGPSGARAAPAAVAELALSAE
jgi:hypothetical protein